MTQHLRHVRPLPLFAVGALLLAGCSSVNVWPFGGDKPQGRSAVPADATEFRCNGNKRFYVRYLDNGAAAWVIFPDREFRLDRKGEGGTRYGNGSSTLEVKGSEATLAAGAAGAFDGCKAATAN